MSELITVVRYVEGDPSIVLRSPAGDPAGVAAWANGDEIRVSVGRFELSLPWAIADRLCDELDDKIATREEQASRPHPGPKSVVGRGVSVVARIAPAGRI